MIVGHRGGRGDAGRARAARLCSVVIASRAPHDSHAVMATPQTFHLTVTAIEMCLRTLGSRRVKDALRGPKTPSIPCGIEFHSSGYRTVRPLGIEFPIVSFVAVPSARALGTVRFSCFYRTVWPLGTERSYRTVWPRGTERPYRTV